MKSINCNSKTGRFPYEASPHATPRMVDSASGELKTCFGKFGGKFLRQAEDAALRIFDVFAENDAARVFFEASTQRLVDVSPIRYLPGGNTSSSNCGSSAGHLKFQFVRRRILLALRLDEFLPDALFDFVVELARIPPP